TVVTYIEFVPTVDGNVALYPGTANERSIPEGTLSYAPLAADGVSVTGPGDWVEPEFIVPNGEDIFDLGFYGTETLIPVEVLNYDVEIPGIVAEEACPTWSDDPADCFTVTREDVTNATVTHIDEGDMYDMPNGAVVAGAFADEAVVILGVSDDGAWYEILNTGDERGWVLASAVTFEDGAVNAVDGAGTPALHVGDGLILDAPNGNTITGMLDGEEIALLGYSDDGGWAEIIDSVGNRGWVPAANVQVAD
ncbi:MAG: hypothetical protein AAF125_10010, partial [Chloroflexota bacterium]